MLQRLYSAQDLAQLDGDFELDEGRLIPVTPPKFRHGRICSLINARLTVHCETTGQGVVVGNDSGFLLKRDPDTVRGPDVAVVLQGRLPQLDPDSWPEGAPDLVVEVVSPGNSPSDLLRKVAQYLEAGAQLVWVIYPHRRTAVIYDPQGGVQLLGEDQELLGEPVLPGFRCRLGELF